MADRNRRFTVAAIALPFLILLMSGLTRAATITVTTLADPAGLSGTCSLRQAITNANGKNQSGSTNCSGGTGTDTIEFSVTGKITLGSALPAIANTSPGSLTIDGSGQAITLDGANTYTIFAVNSGATLSLQFLTLSDGAVSLGFGGAIFSVGTLNVTNSTFSDNEALDGFGGAIFSEGPLNITNSTFSDNQADFGGAIENDDGTLNVTNSTFSDNQADFGGAIDNDAGTLNVTNCTFSGNQGVFGGAIENDATANIKGAILADSTPDNCGGSAVADVGHNISDDDSCGFSGTSVNNSTTLNLDPAGLQNNGGPTKTIALEGNSEAVDFIPVADCTDQSSPTPLPLTTDQRGFPRPDPGNPDFCDAGAFELQTTPIVISATGERVQIARSTKPDADEINMAFTFTENGFPACDAGDNAFNGIEVLLEAGTCETHDHTDVGLTLAPWVVHTVNHQSYGTFFAAEPPSTISARMVELPTPAAPACGEWTINIEVAGIDSAFLGNGPFSLVLENPDGDQGCFDVTNAIVGNQIDPPTRTVRRGVRR
jgi:CSLREA domain-containing protein